MSTAAPAWERSNPATISCPRCGVAVGPEQDWCLTCGAAARTRLVPTPNWRLPVAALAGVALVAAIALALAFVSITRDDAPIQPMTTAPAQSTTPAPTTPAPTVPPATPDAVPPDATTPGGGTTAPPADQP